ncbi:MAG: hypothetical protein JW751_01795 [Polyangiaceae bacterium]|nr:hypothetical protein [Polyangiaceae bacterium]
MSRGHVLGAIALLVALGAGCQQPYRVGEYVLVQWEEGGPAYPAYVVEVKGRTRFRVHFDGYESRWDEDVSMERILGRVRGPVAAPPPPPKVAAAAGLPPQPSSSAATAAPYRAGERVRVMWRGSPYAATILEVVATDRFIVHYEGYEAAWDEPIHIDRIVTK